LLVPAHRKHTTTPFGKIRVFKKSKEKVDKANETAVQDLATQEIVKIVIAVSFV